VFPHPQKDCDIFGVNDSLSLTGFGDGHNVNTHGAVFNAWRRQDCCLKATGGLVFFIGSVAASSSTSSPSSSSSSSSTSSSSTPSSSTGGNP
jgi:hypothetical protein